MNSEKQLVLDFIDAVWNKQRTDLLMDFVGENYVDHSLPPGFPEGAKGTKMWIAATSKSFQHSTTIEHMISEGNKVCIQVSMKLRHIGEWRGHAATGAAVTAGGYRFFELVNGRISQQWALIDGNRIEEAIAGAGDAHGCRLAI